MSKKTKNIPKLRFPEFANDGEWEEKELNKLGNTYNGLSGKTAQDFGYGNSNYITYKNIFDNSKINISIFENVNIETNEKQNLVKFGDIFFTISSETREETGMSSVLLEDTKNTYLNSFCFGYRLNNFDILSPYFARFYFRATMLRNKISRLAQGSTRFNLSKEKVMQINISLPSLAEQQKIADCLSSLDELITSSTKKVELLKEHKKGLLQQLFPQEGESVPRLRFPEFANSGEWEERELNKLGNTYNGLSGKTAQDFGYGNSNYITYKNIFDNSKINISIFENVNIETNEKQNLVKFGDIFFTISSETREETGMSSVLLEDTKNTYLNSFCFGYRLNNFDILSPYFARFYFRATMLRNKISRLAQGSTRFNLSKEKVMQINISLPSLPEQQKIADCLSSLDELITSSTKKVELLKEHKKGLMQQLFPSNEE